MKLKAHDYKDYEAIELLVEGDMKHFYCCKKDLRNSDKQRRALRKNRHH